MVGSGGRGGQSSRLSARHRGIDLEGGVGLGRRYIRDLLSRVDPQVSSSPQVLPPESDFSWYKNTNYLRLFIIIGEIIIAQGATSYEDLKLLAAKKGFAASPNKLRGVITDIEKKHGNRTGKNVLILDRKTKASGNITDDGRELHTRIKDYINDIDIYLS